MPDVLTKDNVFAFLSNAKVKVRQIIGNVPTGQDFSSSNENTANHIANVDDPHATRAKIATASNKATPGATDKFPYLNGASDDEFVLITRDQLYTTIANALATAFAGINGATDNVFNVADAANDEHAIRKGQVDALFNALGDMADQNHDTVDIDGGFIDGTPIGASSQQTGRFTSLRSSQPYRQGIYTIADNDFAEITEAINNAGILTIGARSASYSGVSALCSFVIVGSRFVNVLAQTGATVVGSTISGPPTGTSGNNGEVTVFSSDNGKLYIENRDGSTISINIMVFGA